MSNLPKTSVIRVIQPSKDYTQPEKEPKFGLRKMFRGAKERLDFVASEIPSAIDDFKSHYPREKLAPMPYMVCELEPSAIAKSHSAREVLRKNNLHVVGGRRLEERIIHGAAAAYTRFSQTMKSAARCVPAEKTFDEWDAKDRAFREEAKKESARRGEKVKPERVRRALLNSDMLWNDVAQLSTIRHIRALLPTDKLKYQNAGWFAEARCALLVTFPRVPALHENVEAWLQALEAVASECGVKSLRILRTSETILKELKEVSGRIKSKLISLDAVKVRGREAGDSIVILAESNRDGALTELAKLSFVHALEPAEWNLSAAGRGKTTSRTVDGLPPVGLVDTGIPTGTPLEPFVLDRRGKAKLRDLGRKHAEQVAGLMTADSTMFPWMTGSPGEKCALIDVAALDGAESLTAWRASIEEATPDEDFHGVVNLSANVKSDRRNQPEPEISALGAMLDDQALEAGDLLVVNSAGNSGSVSMDPPADGVHLVSVGAVMRTPDGAYERCDYSSFGGGIAHNVKPTLVVPLHDPSKPGDDAWRTQFSVPGTSFAAPVVSRLAANLMHRRFTRDETLVLMIHNAVQPGKDILYQPTVADLENFGFGLPPSIDACDSPDMSRFTLLFKERNAIKGAIRYLTLPVPEELEQSGAFVRLTAFTRAPVSAQAGEEYVACEVPTRLRMIRRNPRSTTHLDLPPEPDDFSQRYETHRVRYGWKWSVLRRFSKEIRFKDFKTFELRIGPVTWRDWASPSLMPGLKRSVEVQCALTFYPLDDKAPGFFDSFQKAFVEQKIEFQIPIDVELEAEVNMRGQQE